MDFLSGLFGGPVPNLTGAAPTTVFGGMGTAHPVPTFGAPEQGPSVGGSEGNSLASMLRGVQAPRPPETQRLGGPSMAPAPRAPTAVKSGDLLALMQLIGAGGGATAKNDYQLPSTLGAALRGRG